MTLEPDVLKLDRSLVTRAHEHPAKAALIEAISRYALRTGTRVCAEGAECLEELRLLADLDVGEAQGWVIGRPSTTFEQADKAARRACISALSMILEVGDPTEAGDPDLAGVLSRIATTESLDELARLMGWVSALLGCAKTALSLCDPATQTIEAVLPDAWLPNGRRFNLSEFPLTDEVLRRNVVAQVVAGAPGADEEESAFLKHEGFGALLMVPVYSGPRSGGPDRVLLDRGAPLDAPPDPDHALRRGRHRSPATSCSNSFSKSITIVRVAAGQSAAITCRSCTSRRREGPRASRRPSAGRGRGAARRLPGRALPYRSRCHRPAARGRRSG